VVFLNPFFPYWGHYEYWIAVGLDSLGLRLSGFLAGGLGMGFGLAWTGYFHQHSNGEFIPNKIGELMGLGLDDCGRSDGHRRLLLGGFSGLTGVLFQETLFSQKTQITYNRGLII